MPSLRRHNRTAHHLDILAEGKVIVFGAGPRPEGSTTKSLSDYFPVYGGANINLKHALTVTKGKVYSNVVFSIGNLGAPANGSLVLNNDVAIDYMGFVSESSGQIGEDEVETSC